MMMMDGPTSGAVVRFFLFLLINLSRIEEQKVHTIASFGSFVPAVDRRLPGFEHANQSKWEEPFYFVQVTDIQFGFIGERKNKAGWEWEIENARKFVEAVKGLEPKPKFVVMTGDLVHAMPGDPKKEPQEKDFIKAFSGLDQIPFFCLPGNHDIGNTPSAGAVADYKTKFGDDYYSFWYGGIKFIVQNIQFIKDGYSKVPTLKEEHEKWFLEELADDKGKNSKHVIVLQHIPWFFDSPDEDDDYFNIEKGVRGKWLNRLKDAGVRYVFSGHCHRNAGGKDGDLEMTVTSALGAQLGNDQPGYRIVEVYEDRVTHKYFGVDEAPVNFFGGGGGGGGGGGVGVVHEAPVNASGALLTSIETNYIMAGLLCSIFLPQ